MAKKTLTISDWVIGMGDSHPDLAESLHSTKKQDNERLRNSGLPIYADFRLPYLKFLENQRKLIKFLQAHGTVCVRALPRTPKLPRRYKLGVKSLDQAVEFLNSSIQDPEIYDILVSEQQPQKYSGIIILKPDQAVIEIGRLVLDKFSHGDGKRYVGNFDNEGINKFRARGFSGNYQLPISPKIKTLMNRALRCIKSSKEICNKGYFEFIVTDKNEIKFLDYKVAKGYFK